MFYFGFERESLFEDSLNVIFVAMVFLWFFIVLFMAFLWKWFSYDPYDFLDVLVVGMIFMIFCYNPLWSLWFLWFLWSWTFYSSTFLGLYCPLYCPCVHTIVGILYELHKYTLSLSNWSKCPLLLIKVPRNRIKVLDIDNENWHWKLVFFKLKLG